MRTVRVAGPAASEVSVGRGLLATLSVDERRRALIVDAGLPSSIVDTVRSALEPTVEVEVPGRDACKSLEVYARVLSDLARAGLSRDGAIIGVGGGAVTDLAGFVASTYLRGVAYYAVPTTLLAQVDAAVGGKTGVNLPEGKNLVGTFWPARHVWCDVSTLATLPPALFREGAAEVFKHGLLTDGRLCADVLAPGFGPEAEALTDVVARAIEVKADVVTRDPTERGERAHLNLGHTLGHALEAASRQTLPHGDAVGYGLHFAALLSRELGGADLSGHTAAFLRYQRPLALPQVGWRNLATFMSRDKKADSDGLRFVLLHDVGRPYLARVPEGVLVHVFDHWRQDVETILGINA